jgi:hypothetical protein
VFKDFHAYARIHSLRMDYENAYFFLKAGDTAAFTFKIDEKFSE